MSPPERARAAELAADLEAPVQVVAGKGGVGRTTVAAALALRLARRGHRTLLLEVDAPDSAARALGVAPAPDHPREVFNNLFLCRMTPAGSLKEYALLVLRFKLLYRLVFENELVRYLLRSIPSLAEVTMLGKAWWHATQEKRPDGRPRFDRLVIDAPATGHAITFLSVARTVADVAPAGVMKDQSELMARFVESARMHVVALPEEMPVNEGLELMAAVPDRLRIRLGAAIVNRTSSPLLSPAESEYLSELSGPAVEPYLRAVRVRRAREAIEAEHEARFARSGRPLITLPEVDRPAGLERVEAVMVEIDREAGTEPLGEDGQPWSAPRETGS